MLPSSRIVEKVKRGEVAVGMYLKSDAPENIRIAAEAGLDFVRIDAYQTGIGIEKTAELIRAAYKFGITPTVRVPKNDAFITSVLRNGALSITLPAVENSEDARALSQLCLAPPAGKWEPDHLNFSSDQSPADRERWMAEEFLVTVQIETAGALRDLHKIAALVTVDMVHCGRSDLAAALGIPGGARDPQILSLEREVIFAATKAGKLSSIHCPPGDDDHRIQEPWVRQNIACLTVGADTQILQYALNLRMSSLSRHLTGLEPVTEPPAPTLDPHRDG